MDASTLRDTAGTITETVSDLAHTVAEVTPEVTSKVGETALKLAALTPWVEEASTSWFRRRWMFAVAGLAALGIFGWWWKNRRTPSVDFESARGPRHRTRRIVASGPPPAADSPEG